MQEKLRNLQLTQIEILKEIDLVCKKNNLKYSLYAGTLLGAIRHKGFIPWDDDLDICMPRKDYEKFLEIWKDKEHPGFLIQNKEREKNFSQSFTKIRKKHTTFLQKGEPKNQYHTGIFVDIFPIDRMPNGFLKRKIFQIECILYQIYTREFAPIYGKKWEKISTNFLLFIIPKKCRPTVRKKLLNRIKKWNCDKSLHTIAIETVSTIKMPLPINLLDEYIDMEFDGERFMCFKMWDEYLSLKYHNYMHWPPEKERVWKHQPLILDFKHNYEEINND